MTDTTNERIASLRGLERIARGRIDQLDDQWALAGPEIRKDIEREVRYWEGRIEDYSQRVVSLIRGR